MDKGLKQLLQKPPIEWDDKDNALFKKLSGKKYTLKDVLQVAQTEWSKEDEEGFEEVKKNLPKNVVKLPVGEEMVDPGHNAKPLIYTVRRNDTLKKISELFGVSYGELTNHLLNKQGSTSISIGQEIEIPRHFIDLSSA